jgi:F420 biosynthesis protein FbiB-like protein
MPDIVNLMKNRRSIRKYSVRKVSRKILNEILEAARWAPSAHNSQPWRFTILNEKKEKEVLAESMAKAWIVDLVKNQIPLEHAMELAKRSVKGFTRAPTIVIAGVTRIDVPKHADANGNRVEADLAIQSLGAAIQNVLLAAHSRGLGACWFCAPAFCKAEVRKALRLPDEFEPQALITLGYAAEKPEAPQRKPLREILVHVQGAKTRNERNE